MDKDLIMRIMESAKAEPWENRIYEDAFSVCRILEAEDAKFAHSCNHQLRDLITTNLRGIKNIDDAFDLYKKTLLFDAPTEFDAYMLYLEINRRPNERFYQPRRKVLKVVVDALQDLYDGDLQELFVSMPPRIGKTTSLLFFVSWILGRDSEKSNLYSAYSDTITKAFYNGINELLNDKDTYLWHDVFPGSNIVSTNAQEETMNIDRIKRYPSITCRSLYGTLNGACDCNGLLISDDLIGGIEEALNKDRLVAAWSKVDNNLLPRAKETAKVLWCGTRWSMSDPAGLRMDLLKNDERFKNRKFKIINIPALDEKDESNFLYDYGVGFSTEYYRQRRASFEWNNDLASWNAQYMGEPIEREGTLFTPDDFRYYNGELPDSSPDRIFMTVDPAFGGGDFVAAPCIIMYGDDWYLHDVVFNNGDKTVTQPLIAGIAYRNCVGSMEIEADRKTEAYKEGIEAELKKYDYHIVITTKVASNDKAKEQRIFEVAPDIRKHFIFREPGKRTKEYELFLQNLFCFKISGKNKHDDAPDSLAMAVNMIYKKTPKLEIFRRVI